MRIRIELDNPNRSYLAGQAVTGKVIIQNGKPEKVKKVTIQLLGWGRVHWTEHDKSSGLLGGLEPYTTHEDYVTSPRTLAGDGDSSILLPPGATSYPFNFPLPTNLPSSFQSHLGQVSYLLRGEVKRHSLFKFDREVGTGLPFTVIGIFDLNLQPGALMPQECDETEDSKFRPGRDDNLKFVFSVPTRSGFVPGEAIDFKADITNGSNKQIAWVRASLQQVTSVYAEGKCKTKKRFICEIQDPAVDNEVHRIWEGKLLIPAIPPTKLGGRCQIIDLQYFVCIEVRLYGMGISTTAALPVMIGTIPLRSTFGNLENDPQNMPGLRVSVPQLEPSPSQNHPSAMPTLPSTSRALIPSENVEATEPEPAPEYSDLPPPSYAEAVGSEGLTWSPDGEYVSTRRVWTKLHMTYNPRM